MSRENLNSVLSAATFLFLALALATLMPHDNAMVSDLGYHTLCPFAPYSTLTLLFLAGVGWVVQRYRNAQGQ